MLPRPLPPRGPQLAWLIVSAFVLSACSPAPASEAPPSAAAGSTQPGPSSTPPDSARPSESGSPTSLPGTTIALDANPVGLIGAASGIWLWDDYSSQVVHLDPATNAVLGSIATGDPRETRYGSPKIVATDGVTVWTTDVATHALLRIEPETDTIVDQIILEQDPTGVLPAGIEPFGLAVAGNDLWVSDFDNGVVVRVDIAAKRIVDVVVADHPEGLALAFGSVWIIEHRVGTVVRYDPLTRDTIRIVVPGTGDSDICGMCIDKLVASTDSIWLPLNRGRGVARIDPATNVVRIVIPMNHNVIDLSVDGDRIWVIGLADGPVPCLATDGLLAEIDPVAETFDVVLELSCAASVAAFEGDVWVGTVDTPIAVVRLSQP